MNKKVVVLILSTTHPVFNEFKVAIKNTWMRDLKSVGVPCFFYEGGADSAHLDNDTIRLPCPDTLPYCAKKLRLALQFVHQKLGEVHILYRTNLSSFIDVPVFLSVIDSIRNPETAYLGLTSKANLISEYFYANQMLKNVVSSTGLRNNVYICSGAGVFIGQRHINSIMNTHRYDRYVDDVMVRLCVGYDPDRTAHVDRFDFVSGKDPRCSQAVYDERVKNGLFHYRFKTDNRVIDALMLQFFADPRLRQKMCINPESSD